MKRFPLTILCGSSCVALTLTSGWLYDWHRNLEGMHNATVALAFAFAFATMLVVVFEGARNA